MRFHPLYKIEAVNSPDSNVYAVHKHSQAQNIIFQVYTYIISGSSQALEVPFRSPTKTGNSAVLHHQYNNNNNNINNLYISSDAISPHSINMYSQNLYQSVAIHLNYVFLVLLFWLLKYLGL